MAVTPGTTGEFDFVKEQANAWSEVVSMMLEDPRNAALNGSVNGPGSSMEYTGPLREEPPKLLRKYGVSTMFDIPCGDMMWMRHVDLSSLYSYLGMDCEPRLIEANKVNFAGHDKYRFICANALTRKRFPKVDLILCRDFLQHLTNEYISMVLERFKESGSGLLLATNYPGSSNEFDYRPNDFTWLGYIERPHDLTQEPFGLARIDGIEETPTRTGIISRRHELALFDLKKERHP
jgi:hypothetical protein